MAAQIDSILAHLEQRAATTESSPAAPIVDAQPPTASEQADHVEKSAEPEVVVECDAPRPEPTDVPNAQGVAVFLLERIVQRAGRNAFHRGLWDPDAGKWSMIKCKEDRKPTIEELIDHVLGRAPINLYCQKVDDPHTRLLYFDIDAKPNKTTGLRPDPEKVREVVKLICRLCNDAGLRPVAAPSTSGHGWYVICFWVKNQLTTYVRGYAMSLVKSLGTLPDGVAIEVFPYASVATERNDRPINLPMFAGHPLCDPETLEPLKDLQSWKKSNPVPKIEELVEDLDPDINIETTHVDVGQVSRALMAVDFNDRDVRIACGHALKNRQAAFGPNGPEIAFKLYCQLVRLDDPNKPIDDIKKQWDGFRQHGKAGFSAIFHHARKHGWKPDNDSFFRCTQQSTSLLVEQLHGRFHRYVVDERAWWYFDPELGYWTEDHGEAALRRAVQHCMDYLRGYALQRLRKGVDVETMKGLLVFCDRSANVQFERSVCDYLTSHSLLTCKAEAFGVNTSMIVFQDRLTVDVDGKPLTDETGAQVASRNAMPEDMGTGRLNVLYAPEAPTPTWDSFVDFMANGRKKPARVIEECLGAALCGAGPRMKSFLFLYGPDDPANPSEGGNQGKTTLMNFMSWLMGDWYGTINMRDLARAKFKNDTGLSPQIVKFFGKRLMVAIEVGGVSIDEELFRMMTSDDAHITGRGIGKGHIDFTPTHLFAGFGNKQFRLLEDLNATWNRVKTILCDKSLVAAKDPRNPQPGEKDPAMLDKLKLEAPAIVAKLIRAYRATRDRGFEVAVDESMVQTNAAHRRRDDVVRRWAGERLEEAVGAMTPSAAMLSNFRAWYAEEFPNQECPVEDAGTLLKRLKQINKEEGDTVYDINTPPGGRFAVLHGWKVRVDETVRF